jgi:hypothetical protein
VVTVHTETEGEGGKSYQKLKYDCDEYTVPATSRIKMPTFKNIDDLRQFIPPDNGLDLSKTNRHIAILCKGNRVLASAMNQFGSRSFGSGYTYNTIHAEINVIKKLGNIKLLNGATMYIFRTGKGCNEDSICHSRPCPICQKFLEKCIDMYGLRRVFYSVNPDGSCPTPSRVH